MESMLHQLFPDITWTTAILVVLIGFIGGVLSGFIGSGGAFFMTPGMMNLGVIRASSPWRPTSRTSSARPSSAPASTPRWGTSTSGSPASCSDGHRGDTARRLDQQHALQGRRGRPRRGGRERGSRPLHQRGLHRHRHGHRPSLLWDALRTRSEGEGPSQAISTFLVRLNLKPIIRFPVSDVEVSLWILLPAGLATGYLAGTISVGGFIGVPAMIYLFGVPTAVAAGNASSSSRSSRARSAP